MKKQSQKLKNLHQNALTEWDKIQSAYFEERLNCLKDRRFYIVPGAQWEGSVGTQFENKPKFEINKAQLGVTRIKNEYLNNRITVSFKSKTGEENDQLASTCNALYRADEQDSQAEEAYDNAFEEGIGGGIGAWRLCAEYEDEEDIENEYQRIRFKPIYDADSCVFFDLGSKLQDKSDAKRCYVISPMSIDEYREEYEDDPSEWPREVAQVEFDWATPDTVYIAELYQVEYVNEEWKIFEDPLGNREKYRTEDLEDDYDTQLALRATSAKEVDTRIIKRKRVRKYIMSGGGILEDCGYIPGSEIPVIATYGKRWIVDGIERCCGHIRQMKDSQRLKNLQVSKLGEISARSSIEKPIFTPEQIKGHQLMWAEDSVKEFPYMLINLIENPMGDNMIAGPLGYTKPPAVPPALAVLLQQTENDIKDLLGDQERVDDIQPNVSGIAVELIQGKIDMQTYIYMSNFAKAIRRCGEIWLGMAKELYIEDNRKMAGIGKQGELTPIELNRPVKSNGITEYQNDLTKANFKVFADVGPSSATKRQATVRNLTAVLSVTQDPETVSVINSLIMMNLEGEGVTEAREYFRRKLLKAGVVEPTEQEAKDLLEAAQNAPKDPNSTYLEAAAQSELAKAKLDEAKTLGTLIDAEGTRAKTLKTLSDIETSDISKAKALRQDLSSTQTLNPPIQGEQGER
jgi:hypothetical protein